MRFGYITAIAIAVAIAAALAFLLSTLAPGRQDAFPSILYSIMLIAFLGSSLLASGRIKVSSAIQSLAIWAAIFLLVMIGYTLWERFASENEPGDERGPSLEQGDGVSVTLPTMPVLDRLPGLPASDGDFTIIP